jgi:hypothetical protein
MHLQWVIFIIHTVLRRRVHVELLQPEICATEFSRAVDDDFDGRSEVLKLDNLFGDIENRLLSCDSDT